jgi:hypothetical protein
MKTMLEELRARLDQAIGERKELKINLQLAPYRVGEDDQLLNFVKLEDVGADFIQVRGRLIDRSIIREIEPIGTFNV